MLKSGSASEKESWEDVGMMKKEKMEVESDVDRCCVWKREEGHSEGGEGSQKWHRSRRRRWRRRVSGRDKGRV